MSYVLVLVAIAAVFFGLISLISAIFGKKNRRRRFLYVASSLAILVFSVVGMTFVIEEEARSAGFADLADRSVAKEAGFTDPNAWSLRKTELAPARSVADERNAAALEPLVAYVAKIVESLPARFEDHGSPIAMAELMQPLPADVLAYARFWWVADRIEGDCEFLGQRSNIEMLDPDNGVSSWSGITMMKDDHPNHSDYLAVNTEVDDAVEALGEAVVCPAMYRLLGPDGTLMGDAAAVNGLLDPTLIDKYEIKPEDGILWSSRDYCERKFFLQTPMQQDAHDYMCAQAKKQGF